MAAMQTVLNTVTRLLVVQPSAWPVDKTSCLAKGHLGTYGDFNIYSPVEACAMSLDASAMTTPIAIPHNTAELVWIEEAAVDHNVLGEQQYSDRLAFSHFLGQLSKAALRTTGDESLSMMEELMGGAEAHILLQMPTSTLLAFTGSSDIAPRIADYLPQYYKTYAIPSEPVRVAEDDVLEPIRSVLAGLKYDSSVDLIVNNMTTIQMRNDVRYLTGEDSESPIQSRHSYSSGARVAAKWLKDKVEEQGAECELWQFLNGFAPDVVCRFNSTVNTTGTVLVSAHYDSRGSFGSLRAPGADDDGSGTTAVLSMARIIGQLGVTFRQNVELCFFAGEEQGLYGSRYYSRHLREQGANITAVIHGDMLAYHKAGERPQLGIPNAIGTPEVIQLLGNASKLYSPELSVGFTRACCSDHQSFVEQGFPAAMVFERAGPIADPMYHNSRDLSDRPGYDFDQLRSIAKVMFASLLHVAGFDLPEGLE